MSEFTIHGIAHKTQYDTEQEISLPTPCKDKTPVINNINFSALKYIVEKNPQGLWNEESLNDFRDLLENPPADKIFVTIGQIILSPANNPSQYYVFQQITNKSGGLYLTVEKLQAIKKRKSVAKTPAEKQSVKKERKSKPKQIEQQPLIKEQPVLPKQKRTPKKNNEDKAPEKDIIDPECFFLMKMAEAMEEYCKLTFPNDLKKYKRLRK